MLNEIRNTHKGGLHEVEEPWKEHHDVAATSEAIEQMLAGGTPNWVRWPHEYKSMARESFAAEKERSDKMGLEYRWHDQAVLTDRAARKVNGIGTRDFIEKKLRANGVKCAVTASDWVGPGGIRTVALWATPPRRTDKLRFVGSLDVPMMWEWSVLHLDHHNIPSGRESIGWRDIAVQLVQKEIISEAQCHKIFGAPPPNAISARYYRTLWETRNGKPYEDPEDREASGN